MHESSIYVLAGMGGLSINEAMCYSLPVICSVCDGTEKDLIQDGVNGYYFESGNADSLAKSIEYLLRNPQMMKAFGDVSLKKSKKRSILIQSAQDLLRLSKKHYFLKK